MEPLKIVSDFGRLVEEHQSPLRRYLWYLTHGDGALADDLAQDTFIKAYERLMTFRGGSFKAWLFVIAYRTFLDYKRASRQFDTLESHKHPVQVPVEGEILNVALDCLEQTEKNLLLLSVVEQFSHSQIEEVTGLPLGTVKSTIKRAKEKLKTHLKNEER